MTPPAARLLLYADLICPFAYLTHHRLRRLRPEFADRLALVHPCLPLEYVNREPTQKPILDLELPILMLEEPGIPYQPWSGSESGWPATIWPAFEAVKCAERQGWRAADDLAWAIRVAFFRDSRCISLRHVLLDLAAEAGLDADRFEADFDGGAGRPAVIAEARDGWDRRRVPGSPTLILPTGEMVGELGLPGLDLDPAQGNRPVRSHPAPCRGDGCLDLLRAALRPWL